MVICGILAENNLEHSLSISMLELLVSICTDNPLAIEQILDESFESVRRILEKNIGVYW